MINSNLYSARSSVLLFLLFSSSHSWGQNPGVTDNTDVQIFPSSNNQSEVQISINRQNPSILVASANTDISGRHTQGRYVSTNGGSTWTGSDELVAGATLDGDPCTGIDAIGNIYITTMNSAANGIQYIKSTNNGTSFTGLATVVTHSGSGVDKPWIAVDNNPNSTRKNNFYATYVLSSSSYYVNFLSSTNGGTSFSASKSIKTGFTEGPIVQTGPTGQVYVCWSEFTSSTSFPAVGFGFSRSTDGGTTFTTPKRAVSYVGVQFRSSGLNGTFNYTSINDLPSMAVDNSGKTFNGRIYVAFPAVLNGNQNDVIQISHSDDQGDTWSAPILVSRPAAYQSWEPSVCVDQATGNVFVAYSNLGSAGNIGNTWVAVSTDGGSTFVNQLVSDVSYPVEPVNNTIYRQGYMGDYIGVAAHNGKAYVAWTDKRSGTWQIYVSEVDFVPAIVGPSAFCNSAQFSVTNLPPYLSVSSWSVSPTGVVSINSSGLATKLTQGNTTVTATLNNGQTVNYNITTIPQVSTVTSTNLGCNTTTQSYTLNATPNMSGATSWRWTVDDPVNSGISLYSPSTQSTRADVARGGGVSVTFTDACGEVSQRNGITIYNSCPHTLTVAPNPATSTVTVTRGALGSKVASITSITEVNILDLQGNLKKHRVFNNVSSANINVADLATGVYIIEIVEDNYRSRQLFQVLK